MKYGEARDTAKLSRTEQGQRDISMGSQDKGRIFNAFIKLKEKLQRVHERKGDLQCVHKTQTEASVRPQETGRSYNTFTRDKEDSLCSREIGGR
jgi:hypothetical protein